MLCMLPQLALLLSHAAPFGCCIEPAACQLLPPCAALQVGAARSASLEALLQDPQLSPLVGCVHQVRWLAGWLGGP